MSQENVEIVRAGFEALNTGGIEAVLPLYASDVEWWDREDDPGASVHRGHDGVRGMMSELTASISGLRVTPQDFVDAGDYVVVPVRVAGRGRASGAAFEEDEVHVFRLRDGKIVELREYRNNDEAVKALGPAE